LLRPDSCFALASIGGGRETPVRAPAIETLARPARASPLFKGVAMRARSFWACLLLAPAFALGAPAPEAYTIKPKYFPDPGKTVTVKRSSKEAVLVKFFDADGKVINENKIDTVKEEVYTEQVLEKGDKWPKKFTHTYSKAVVTTDGNEEALSYQGCTIIYELKGQKYEVTVQGDKRVRKKDLEDLKRHINDNMRMDGLLLPKKAVKLKEVWKLDVTKLVEMLPADTGADVEKSKADARLVKSYLKKGKQFGVIEVNLSFAMISLPGGLKFSPPAMMDAKSTIDVCIDGSDCAGLSTSSWKLKGKGTIDEMGTELAWEMSVDTSSRMEQSSEK
jgi:hypothetical protein